MEITWLGHSSFLLKSAQGISVLTDPFDESVGYPVYDGAADIVTISHHHFDHDYTKQIKGSPKIIGQVGEFTEGNIQIQGFPSFHDKMHGAKRGENVIFVIKIDNYRICHLGDLGHTLTAEEIDKIGKVDVLCIPVGGFYTIDGAEAGEVAVAINSHIILPMHYKTPKINFPIEGAEPFLTYMKNGVKLNSSTLRLDEPLEGFNQVKLLTAP